MTAATPVGQGHLAGNVMHFARLLRAAGLAVGSDRIGLALQALQVAGLGSREELHAVLGACLLDRIEHRELFDQAFALFWREADLAARLHELLQAGGIDRDDRSAPPPASRRLADALLPPLADELPPARLPGDAEANAALSWNERELLRKADFEAMTADEWRQARRLLARLPLAFAPMRTRRSRPAAQPGRADWRATLQSMARHGGELREMRWRRPRLRPAPLVLLADISGSMSRYSRMLLHFAHLLSLAGSHVESFVFGTRLTRITHAMRSRDPDLAVAQVVRAVDDWSGGTRITGCLHEFNQRWARRELCGPATVLLITDGLEHGDTRALSFEMDRLQRSCKRLVWLNPLLRYEAFEARAGGIRAMLPHVDHFLPTHNLASLEQLVALLAAPPPRSPRMPAADWMERRSGRQATRLEAVAGADALPGAGQAGPATTTLRPRAGRAAGCR